MGPQKGGDWDFLFILIETLKIYRGNECESRMIDAERERVKREQADRRDAKEERAGGETRPPARCGCGGEVRRISASARAF